MSNLRFAGDISIEKLNIISVNGVTYSIKNQLIGIQIFEDLFGPFITGILTFSDSLDFINALPVVGQEVLDIEIYTPTLQENNGIIKTQFFINELKNRELLAERNALYELTFISKEAIVDANIKLSKGYSGKISEIANNVLTDKLVNFNISKNLNIEPTKNSIKYVSNYWSPIKNMMYLCDRAISTTDSPTYIFFENRDGFNFGSLGLLSSAPTVMQEFKYNSSTQIVGSTGSSYRDINLDYQRIINFSLKSGFNLINRLTSGLITSGAFGFDITSKRFKVKGYDYFSNFETNPRLNQYKLFTNKIPTYYTSKIFTEPDPYENFEGFGSNSNFNIIQQRISEIGQLNDFKLEILVPGRLDYTVGQIVTIKTFQLEPLSKENDDLNSHIDKIFSGRYLISAINHYITRELHECSMELIKDSYILGFDE